MEIRKEDILQTGNLEFLAKKSVEGFITGFHKSPFHGFSVEFAEHRQYNQGESTKSIDWKLYGRTDKLYTKRYDEETNLRCQFLIDTSSSMSIRSGNGLTKLQYALWCTAVFTQMLKKQRDASSLCFFDQGIREYTKTGSSSRHYTELTSKLSEYLHYEGEQLKTDISSTLHTIASQIHKRSLVVLFTDFFEKNQDLEPLLDAIKHLKHFKHEIIIFHTLNVDQEIDFNYGNSPVTFEDAETGEVIKVNPNEVKNEYQNKISEYNSHLKNSLRNFKVSYEIADTTLPVEHALIPFLVKRKRMR